MNSHCWAMEDGASLNFLPSSTIPVHAQLLSRVWLFAIPWTVACQASLSMEFPSQEYWRGLPFPFPRDLPNPGIKPASPALAGGFYFLPLSHWERSFECAKSLPKKLKKKKMMVPKVKAPWPLLAKSWARALGRVLKTYTSNGQEAKRCVQTRQVSCPIWHGVARCEAAGSGPGRIGLRLCMLIENSQKVNEQVSLALVTWVTFPHFSPLLSSLANKRRKEQKSDRLLWKASHCWPRKKKKNIHLQERKSWPGGEASSL